MATKLPMLLAGLILVSVSAFCQRQQSESYDYKFVTYADGNYISCRENIYVDDSGFLWLTTQEALLLYDGLNLTVFSKNSITDPLDINDIQLFKQTSDGKFIIVSSDNTVSLFDTRTKKIVGQVKPDSQYLELIGNTFSSEQTGSIFLEDFIVPDDEGGFYLIFKSDDAYQYQCFYSSDGNSLTYKNTFDIGRISSVQYSRGELFVASRDRITRLDSSFQIIQLDTIQLNSVGVSPYLTKDSQSNIYVYENCLRDNCTIYKYDNVLNEYQALIFPKELRLKEIHKIRIENGIFWFFGVGKLISYNPKTKEHENIFPQISKSFENFESPPLISHYTSIESQGDIFWLGSGYGLVQLVAKDNSYNIFLKSDPNLCNGFCSMRGIDDDAKGNLWLASYSGLIKKTAEDDYSKIDVLTPHLNNGIYSLSVNEPYVLVNDVLYNIENNSYKIIIPEKENGHITNTALSSEEYLLSSCYNNGNQIYLYRYNSETKKRIDIELPLANQNLGQITDMLLSHSKENVYLTTALGGSFKLDLATNTLTSIIPEQYWQENEETHFCAFESTNQLYIGTSSRLLELDMDFTTIQEYSFPIFSTNQIVKDRNFFSIVEENDSTLWLGTDKGIISFNKYSKEFRDYTQLGYLGNEEFNRQSSFKINEKLLFGSVNGVYEIFPQVIRDFENEDNQTLSLVSIQHFDGQTQGLMTDYILDNEEKIIFQHNDKMLNFRISLPEFRSQQSVFYSYFLDGFHTEWSNASSKSDISFTNLDPGKYSLQVKAGNDAKLLNPKTLELYFEITEPWYLSFWFKSLLLFLALSLAYAIFKIRYLQLLKYQQLRSDISKDLHDDVGTMLTGIAMQSELMEKFANDDIKELASSIAMRSREAMSSMRDTVWAIDSRKDSTLDLKDRILNYLLDTMYPKDISYTLDSNIKNSDTKILPNIRQTVYLIAKESINNIVKHSDTTKVDIQLHVNKKFVTLSIKDYGSFREIKKTGQGLMNMNSRARNLNGEYRFEYDHGFFTSLKIPLK